MKKKYSIEEIEKSFENSVQGDGYSEEEKQKDHSSAKKNKRNKNRKDHKKRRIVITIVAVLLLTILGWFGFITYKALKNMFNGEAPSLLNLIGDKQLKGESSGRVNILLLGMGDKGHEGENLTDTLMVVSLDTKTKEVAMISIPRDLYVKVDDYGYSKINAAHAYGEKYKVDGGGPKLASDTISNVIDQPIHYYARVDFTGFKKIIDLMGGVDIDVEKDLYDPLYPGGTFYIKKGPRHMNGETALKYARSRETTSDFDRAKRQQQVIIAVKEKALSSQTLLNPKKISDIIQTVGDHVKTDMQLWEGQRLYNLGKNIDNSKIINKVFDNGPGGLLVSDSSYGAGYTLIPRLGLGKYAEIQDAVKNIFVESKLKTEEAKISVLNGTTRSGIASNLAEKLRNKGLNVINTSTSEVPYAKTTIIDYSDDTKSGTITYLKELLGAEVQKSDKDSSSDIDIILGKDYTTN